ncbi:hypothetical protein [Sphaerisporangium fuscum]|uniref:hypothetical protein n=1 Tax=Sphaerisporangium fuscum TaxID=2835868 RepID=UPI001BDCD920|nr:hypothetical protein [Sphaerisporangium fuscum]
MSVITGGAATIAKLLVACLAFAGAYLGATAEERDAGAAATATVILTAPATVIGPADTAHPGRGAGRGGPAGRAGRTGHHADRHLKREVRVRGMYGRR